MKTFLWILTLIAFLSVFVIVGLNLSVWYAAAHCLIGSGALLLRREIIKKEKLDSEPVKLRNLILNLFDAKYMANLGFAVIRDEKIYGEAISTLIIGKTVITWNKDGPEVDYFGNPIKAGAIYLAITEDGGTRTVFNGHIWNREDLEFILKRVN